MIAKIHNADFLETLNSHELECLRDQCDELIKRIITGKNKSEFYFSLPWPPSINSYWRRARGRVYISERGKIFRSEVIKIIKSLGLDIMIKERIILQIVMRPPDRRRRDCDNIVKITQDSLVHANFIVDDEQVDKLIVIRGGIVKGGEVNLKIIVIE